MSGLTDDVGGTLLYVTGIYPLTPWPANAGFFSLCSLHLFHMITVHATVSKTTDGRTATWRFIDIDGKFAAIGDNRKIIACDSIEHMRGVYRRYTAKYGFTPVTPVTA